MKYEYNNKTEKKGSILIVAIFFTAIIGVLIISYLKVASGELKRSDKTFLYNTLLNLSEAGAEEVTWALNNDDWTGWQEIDSAMVKRLSNVDIGNGNKAIIYTYVENYDGTSPVIYTEGNFKDNDGTVLRKQLRLDLTTRGVFANGLTSKDALRFVGGNVKIDSYNSSNGDYDSVLNRNDKGTAASISVANDAVDLGNAEVYGYVATGGADPVVGPNGKIYGSDTPNGVDIDSGRITKDFYMNFPDISIPALANAITTYPSGNTVTIGGSEDLPDEYKLSSIDINSNQKLIIDGVAILIIDNDIDVKGEIEIKDGGQLTIYVDGDVTIGGNGFANKTNKPEKLVIYGTSTTNGDKTIKLHGKGSLQAAVYAPYSKIDLKGGGGDIGKFSGAVVGYKIFFNGNYEFHYDEQLASFDGDNETFKLKSWRELYSSTTRIDFDAAYKKIDAGLVSGIF